MQSGRPPPSTSPPVRYIKTKDHIKWTPLAIYKSSCQVNEDEGPWEYYDEEDDANLTEEQLAKKKKFAYYIE